MHERACAAMLGAALFVGCSGQGRSTASFERTYAPAYVAPTIRTCRAPLGLDVTPVGDARSGSTVVLARVHQRLLAYVSDEDTPAIRILDVDRAAELGAIPTPGRPARMLMLPGGRLAVAMRDRGEVAVYSPSPIGDTGLDPLCSLDTPDEPVDLAATPDGKTLMALSDWGHTLSAFDLDTAAPTFSVDLPRAPRALVASHDGTHAYVAHAAGGSMSSIDLRAKTPAARTIPLAGTSTDVSSFPTRAFRGEFLMGESFAMPMMHPPLRPRATTRARKACQGFALAEETTPTARVFVPAVEVVTGDLEVPSSGYGPGASTTPELPVVAVLDESKGTTLKGSLVAHERGPLAPPPCLLPRAAVAARGSLYVACMGIDAVVEYDASRSGAETPERRRWSVPGGPTGIALHGSRAVVWSQFGHEATILSLSGDADAPIRIPVAVPPRSEDGQAWALGRALFHASSDSRISSDGRACASCHPDGRDDGLVWSTPGGPRQTPMLAGRLASTAPYGWDGAGSDVVHHLGHTFARLEGQGLPPRELAALVRYVTTLEGPTTRDTHPDGAIAKGRDVFFSSGCATCHSVENAWSDGERHDVGSMTAGDEIASFDTPSLHFVSGTAPYFHDGRYATLRALLSSREGPMGVARNRTPADLDALEAFVRSL